MSFSFSKVGDSPSRESTTSRWSRVQISGRLESSNQTFESKEAVVSRPARRMLRSSERILIVSDVWETSSWRKT